MTVDCRNFPPASRGHGLKGYWLSWELEWTLAGNQSDSHDATGQSGKYERFRWAFCSSHQPLGSHTASQSLGLTVTCSVSVGSSSWIFIIPACPVKQASPNICLSTYRTLLGSQGCLRSCKTLVVLLLSLCCRGLLMDSCPFLGSNLFYCKNVGLECIFKTNPPSCSSCYFNTLGGV